MNSVKRLFSTRSTLPLGGRAGTNSVRHIRCNYQVRLIIVYHPIVLWTVPRFETMRVVLVRTIEFILVFPNWSYDRLLIILLIFGIRQHVEGFLPLNHRLKEDIAIERNRNMNYLQTNSFSATVCRTITKVQRIREADFVERMIGGVRFESVPIPEAMKETTLFVGNLCEFVKDEDLSQLFQSVSKLKSLPACVARKVDTSSLLYGFVCFPTVEEKEVSYDLLSNDMEYYT
jgi:RNA recognition motif. (a.k.a. RRM, RBD, or RNP domain)